MSFNGCIHSSKPPPTLTLHRRDDDTNARVFDAVMPERNAYMDMLHTHAKYESGA